MRQKVNQGKKKKKETYLLMEHESFNPGRGIKRGKKQW
jgi:hypothetical protein